MRVGSKVICINDKFPERFVAEVANRPLEGVIYHVRRILITRRGKGILLEEIENTQIQLNETQTYEPSFATHRFREVDDALNIIGEEVEELESVM